MKERARQLRKNSTDAENHLWYFLRNRHLCKHKFRRQYPIPPYIVDFICLSKKLIVELDGSQHANAKTYDHKRAQFLHQQGYSLLRFWNNDVFENVDGVLQSILDALEN